MSNWGVGSIFVAAMVMGGLIASMLISAITALGTLVIGVIAGAVLLLLYAVYYVFERIGIFIKKLFKA